MYYKIHLKSVREVLFFVLNAGFRFSNILVFMSIEPLRDQGSEVFINSIHSITYFYYQTITRVMFLSFEYFYYTTTLS